MLFSTISQQSKTAHNYRDTDAALYKDFRKIPVEGNHECSLQRLKREPSLTPEKEILVFIP